MVLPSLLVDMLEDAEPLPLVTLELPPLPLLTDTPGAPFPTVVWPDTWPLPALIEVDMPLGGFSPGFKCTTLHPLVLVSALLPLELLLLLAAPAAPANANTATPTRAAVVIFMCRSFGFEVPHGHAKAVRHRSGDITGDQDD